MVQRVTHLEHQQVKRNCGGTREGAVPQSRTFFQLTGHKESFKVGTRPGSIMKLSTGSEGECFRKLMTDRLSPYVPKIFGIVDQEDKQYLELQDVLTQFDDASVMDIKMGCRTYREEELDNALKETKLRHDLYEKMVEIDENEPSAEEKQSQAVTKPRYMVWRETVSSTANLGFRIEGMRLEDGSIDKDFKTLKNEDQIVMALMRYATSNKIRLKYLNRLYDIKQALMQSAFFSSHEIIGSSLLFVHSDNEAGIWLIDFAKTGILPENVKITHRDKWKVGNHEDGFMTGIDNLIRIFELLIMPAREMISKEKTLQQNNLEEKSKRLCVKMNGSNVNLEEMTRFLPKLKI